MASTHHASTSTVERRAEGVGGGSGLVGRARRQVSKHVVLPARRAKARALRGVRRAEPIKLNLGGGNWCHYGWQNLDLYAQPAYIDHPIDFRTDQHLPFADGSVSLVFCSHLLEHLSDEAGDALLRDVRRVLKDDGLARIAVPDAGKAIDAYRRGDRAFFKTGGVSCTGDTIGDLLCNFLCSYRTADHSGGPRPPADELERWVAKDDLDQLESWLQGLVPDDATYRGHVNGYDAAKLCGALERAGFRDVRRSAYRSSTVRELRRPAFDVRPIASLFVEARP